MSTVNRMTFSPALEARFAKLLTIYPTGRQRSAVVPMLLYAQDEVGCVNQEVVDEVARRCGVTPLQVDEVIGYYSMLHRKPLGKFHVQVCTNIACQAWWRRVMGACLRISQAQEQASVGRWVDFVGGSGMHGRLFVGSSYPD